MATILVAMFASTGLGGARRAAPRSGSLYIAYIGTYTTGSSKGIYAYRFDASSGRATPLGLVAESPNPSFLASDPHNRFLYAVSEGAGGGDPGNTVSAYAIDRRSGKLTFLNKVEARGAAPCHVSVDASSKSVLVANYDSGNIAAFPLEAGGRLGGAASVVQHHGSSVNHERQEGPHAHCILPSPDNRYALVADLGLDEVLVYRLNPAKATLEANDPAFGKVPAGAGPRHLVFHPSGKFVYVINEMGSSVTAFAWQARAGRLTELQTISTLPSDFRGENYPAEIAVDRAGKFLYGSNRGHDSIAVFAVDGQTGRLTAVEQVSTGGKEPRHFALDPTGKFLWAANQKSDNIVLFRVDGGTGRLTPTGEVLAGIGAPVCVLFVPAE